jgi:membrane-associated phospholipid phosphatase
MRNDHGDYMRWVASFLTWTIVIGAAPGAAQTALPDRTQTAQEPPQKPENTGWATLAHDTVRDFQAFPARRSTWVLIGAGAAGALAAYPVDDAIQRSVAGNDAASQAFKLGRWLGSTEVQAGSAVGLWLIGRYVLPPAAGEPGTNKISHLGFDLIRAHLLSGAIVHTMKATIRRDRPSGACCAFPSGHSAAAFTAAAVLERHLGYRASWPALSVAAYVAISRLVDNRHFLSDVVMGAAVGTASGWTIVGRHGRNEYAVTPVPVRGGVMVALVRIGDR